MALVNVKTKKDLINIRKNIQNNYLQEHVGEQDIHREVEKYYDPLIKPLKKIADETSQTSTALKTITETNRLPAIEETTSAETPAIEAPETEEPEVVSFGNLSDKYLKSGFKKDYDYAYGPLPIDGSSRFKLGNSEVKIRDNDFEIDGETYKGTEGLWELLTQKEPKDYTREDMNIYQEIMLKTLPFINAKGLVKPSRGKKWKDIISDLYKKYKQKRSAEQVHSLRQTVKGSGINVIILPSDDNELVERHRLLLGSLQAGNNGVFNEFQACTDELYKRGYLDKKDLNSLINYF